MNFEGEGLRMGKRTPLYDEHIRMKAKMVDFAGWDMPIQYTSIIEETKTVRSSVGVFDVSHMGEIYIEGPQAIEFVNYVITNDFASIKFGDAIYSPMCKEDGGIIDDLIAYKIDSEKALLVVNAANKDKDYEWLREKAKNFSVSVIDRSDELALIAVQGPKAEELLQKMADIKLSEIGFYQFKNGRVRGIRAQISRTGYTGEDGFELLVDADAAVPLWRSILEYGEEFGIKPAGLGARDLLRLEASYLLYGNDMDETTNPIEAGLSWTVKFDKGDFIGKEALLKVKEEKPKRKLVGMILEGRNIARHGYKIFKDGEEVGFVTSGGYSPTLEKSIALGYVKVPYNKKGTELEIEVRKKTVKAEVVKLPFYRGSVKSRK